MAELTARFCPRCLDSLMRGFIEEHETLRISFPLAMLGTREQNQLADARVKLKNMKYISNDSIPASLAQVMKKFQRYDKMWNCHVLWSATRPHEECAKMLACFADTYDTFEAMFQKRAPPTLEKPRPIVMGGMQLFALYRREDNALVLSATPNANETKNIAYIYYQDQLMPGFATFPE